MGAGCFPALKTGFSFIVVEQVALMLSFIILAVIFMYIIHPVLHTCIMHLIPMTTHVCNHPMHPVLYFTVGNSLTYYTGPRSRVVQML